MSHNELLLSLFPGYSENGPLNCSHSLHCWTVPNFFLSNC